MTTEDLATLWNQIDRFLVTCANLRERTTTICPRCGGLGLHVHA